MNSEFSITILGSSSGIPTSQRNTTAQVLKVHERFFLIDCGEGVQIRLRRNKISFARIDNIFISHLHGDHFFGLFGLVTTFGLLGRKKILNIYSPPGLKKLFRAINEQFKTLSYEINFVEVDFKSSNKIYENKLIQVHTIPMKHRIPAVGYLFSEKQKVRNIKKEAILKYNLTVNEIVAIKEGADLISDDSTVIENSELTTTPPKARSYAFCSDTAYNEPIVPMLRGVDLLYHEATFMQENVKRAVKTGHSTAQEAALMAKNSEVKKLIIGHFSARYKNRIKELESEAKAIFPSTTAVNDGDVFKIT